MIEYGILVMPWWAAILAVAVGVIGAARLTRVITYDDYPPAAWLRNWWELHTGKWAKLITCGWCAGPWVTAVTLASFAVSFLHPALGWAWWLFWGWLALSYLVSQYLYWDEGKPVD